LANDQYKVRDMQRIRLPAGSQVFLGAPAEPMEPEIVAAISRLVDGAPEIMEAHLPQVFVSGAMQAPAQVLVIVTDDRDVPLALDKVGAGLGRILPSGRSIDVWPLSPMDKLLPTVRGAGCRVGRRPRPTGILGRLRRL
jgi:SseB protein C-terminal domain